MNLKLPINELKCYPPSAKSRWVFVSSLGGNEEPFLIFVVSTLTSIEPQIERFSQKKIRENLYATEVCIISDTISAFISRRLDVN